MLPGNLLGGADIVPSAPPPQLVFAFAARVDIAPPVERGIVDGGRARFIAITGGTIAGPMLNGVVLAGGGDWQTILPGGVTRVHARYFWQTDDRTVIGVDNPGLRVASEAVTAQLAADQPVDPDAYYFRTAPRFEVADGRHAWLAQTVFVARGIRRPDHVMIDFYCVE